MTSINHHCGGGGGGGYSEPLVTANNFEATRPVKLREPGLHWAADAQRRWISAGGSFQHVSINRRTLM